MKSILFIFAALLFGFVAQAQTTDAFSIRVDGLGCPFCAYGLEKKFKDVKGIKDIKIDIKTGVMTFNAPSELKLTLEQADERVTKAGYTAKEINITRADGKAEKMGGPEVADSEGNIESKLMVSGNCEMCKARIDKAATKAGASSASWDEATKMLTVKYNPAKVKLADIKGAVVKSGHDSVEMKADSKTYNSLPACCQYRKK